MWRDAVHVQVAVVLATNGVIGCERPERADELRFGVPPRVHTLPVRRLCHHAGQDLEHVILEHVADGARPVIEPAPVGYVELLGHGDLDAVHVGAIQQRLQDRVREAGEQQVLHGVEAEPVIDPVNRRLRVILLHQLVQLLRAGEVAAEWLFHHDPGIGGPASLGDALRDTPEQRRRHLHVEQDVLPLTDSVRHRPVCRLVAAGVDGSILFSLRESVAYFRNWSSPQPLFATPITGTSSTPRSTSPTRAGNVSSFARSPVAPKITRASTLSVGMSAPRVIPVLLSSDRGSSGATPPVAGDALWGQRSRRTAEAACGACAGAPRWAGAQTAPAAPSRSAMCSPTRMPLAMAVSPGLTAPMLGKKLVSATYRLSSSCALQLTSSTEVAGSVPNRQVPTWCAQPASGMFTLM